MLVLSTAHVRPIIFATRLKNAQNGIFAQANPNPNEFSYNFTNDKRVNMVCIHLVLTLTIFLLHSIFNAFTLAQKNWPAK